VSRDLVLLSVTAACVTWSDCHVISCVTWSVCVACDVLRRSADMVTVTRHGDAAVVSLLLALMTGACVTWTVCVT